MADHPRTRILFVHHRSELGGAPTSLYYLIRGLDRERFDPHVYCPGGAAGELFREAGATVHEGAVAGFTHIWASVYRGRRWLLLGREVLRLPGHLMAFNRTLRRTSFDIVHLNDSPMLAAGWIARRHRIPVVWHLRSALPYSGLDRRSRLVRRAVVGLADLMIAINEDIAAIWRVPATIVPNSVDTDRFKPGNRAAARTELGLLDSENVVAYFGFLYPSKGFREFISAAALLRDRGIEATYLIVGGAVRSDAFFRTIGGRMLQRLDLARNYNAEARALVAQLGLERAVRFMAFTAETEVLYRASDVVVSPSQGPEIGRPMLEGAAAGVAVVGTGTTTGGGVLEPGRTTLLTEDFEPETLAEAIGGLLSDPAGREAMGAAARAHALRTFDPATNAHRVEQLYARLVDTPGLAKILFVHHRPQLGGAPTSLAELMRNLDRTRFDPHVYVPDGGPAGHLFAGAGAVVHFGPASVFVHTWDNPYKGLRWLVFGREVLRLLPHRRVFGSLLKRYRFEIVHLNDSPLLPAARTASRRGAHVVWHLRSALAGEGRDRRSRAIGRLIDRWGERAIAIDTDVAARFPIEVSTTIVHNSVVTPDGPIDAAAAKAKLGLPADQVTIGYAGFVRVEKGWPNLLRAFRMLVDEGLRVHFVVVGGGVRAPSYFRTLRGRLLAATRVLSDEETALRTLVGELELEPHVTLLSYRAVHEVYSALDVVAFPNPGVGLGRPVLEAAAYGKPVVASGSRDGAGVLLPEETGILLSDTTPEAIAAALRRLVLEPELRRRLGEAAARHARESFDPALNARKVEAVYESLLPETAGVVPDHEPELEPAGRRAMCGLCGIAAPGRPAEAATVAAMSELIAHRGPDGDGIYAADGIALGSRRLAILDLSEAGAQPFASEDGRLQLAYNGEIYNYRELRARLESIGHRFRSGTDTEVVLSSYREWGERCVERFNGMWAFALWDGAEQRLFCSRDRFGIKPFYYRHDGGRLMFASELKAFRADPATRLSANPGIVRDFVERDWFDHSDETFFAGIVKLPAAHNLVFDHEGLRVRRYWQLERREPPPGDPTRAVRELFLDATRLHIRSDVPVGTCLSGGIDSSAVACTIDLLLRTEAENARPIGERQQTFTAYFEERGFDERPYARAVVEQTQAAPHWITFSAADLVDNLPVIVEAHDEPFRSTSICAGWYVMREAARAGIKVVLDGQGGDEVFAGYPAYFPARYADLLASARVRALALELAAHMRLHGARNGLQAAVRALVPAGLEQTWKERRSGSGTLLAPGLRSLNGSVPTVVSPFPDRLRTLLTRILTQRGLPELLHAEDRNSMTHSIEARVPFLDYRLVELLFSLDGSRLIHRGRTKAVLRDALADLLPPSVAARTDKLGFVTPEATWLRGPLGDLAGDIFASQSFRERGFVDAAAAQKRLTAHRRGELNAGFELWRALNLELWARTFLDAR